MSAPDVISIEQLRVDCVVGVYPGERAAPQPLLLEVALRLDAEEAGRSERLRGTVDYAQVAAQLTFVLQSARFRLLETAAHALARLLLAPPAPGERRVPVEEVTVRLAKPNALHGNGRPALTVTRDRRWAALRTEPLPFGGRDILYASRDTSIYRLNLSPGRSAALPLPGGRATAELVLTEGLLLDGRPAAPGSVRRFLPGTPRRYDNPTAQPQMVLCVDTAQPFPEEAAPAPAPAPAPGGDLAGRVALVTGGAVRVGRAICEELARAGARVIVHCHRSQAQAEALARQLGGGAFVVRGDLRSPDETRVLFQEALGQVPRIDILVNNASIFARTPFPEMTDEDWEEQMVVNLTAPQRCIRHALRAGATSIVNLLDVAAWQPWRRYAAYGAAKAGLLHLTRILALELAPQVRVNAVAPGTVLFPDSYDEAARAAQIARVPLHRIGAPEDVARAVRFLLCEPYLTGVCIPVDGGAGVR